MDPSRAPEEALESALLVAHSTPLAADTLPDSPPRTAGPILPLERIVAFYGNPLARRMGILGELPPEEMLAKLDHEVEAWTEADPSTPVRPALHMIAVMATGNPGPDGKYRTRLPKSVIEDVISLAERRDAIVIPPLPGETVLQKNFPNSFRNTPLLEQLRQLDVGQLVIAGMMTQMCVDSTTRAAADLGFQCLLAQDACATRALTFGGASVAADSVQTAFFAALNGLFAKLQPTAQICAGL